MGHPFLKDSRFSAGCGSRTWRASIDTQSASARRWVASVSAPVTRASCSSAVVGVVPLSGAASARRARTLPELKSAHHLIALGA